MQRFGALLTVCAALTLALMLPSPLEVRLAIGVIGVVAAWAFDALTIRPVIAGKWRGILGYDV
jgi:hypothetical protein